MNTMGRITNGFLWCLVFRPSSLKQQYMLRKICLAKQIKKKWNALRRVVAESKLDTGER
jgi:hypothetical protein